MVTAGRAAEVQGLLARLGEWAAGRPDVVAVGLAGSWARGDARMDSDVDPVLLTTDKALYLEAESWVAELGGLRVVRTGRWGPVTERRFVLPSGLEVEMGVAPPSWAATDPPDPETCEVVREGFAVIYDPEGVLSRFVEACRRAG